MRSGTRILITGANGFVGQWLQKELLAREPGLAIAAAGHGPGAAVALDVSDAAAVEMLVKEFQPTSVVHLAAISAPADARQSPHAAWMVNVMGTLNVALAIRAHAADALLVQVGSSEAYGASFAGTAAPLSEASPLQPLGAYGATKAAADLMIGQMARDGLRAIRFRPFNHTGPGQSDAFVVPAFARQVAAVMAGKAEPVISVGNLSAVRDFLDVRDVVRAYTDAALSDPAEATGLAYNLASGTPRRIGEVLDMLIALSGRAIEVRVDPARLRASEVPEAVGDASLAAADLGWQPQVPFEQTVADVLDDWRTRIAAD